VSRPVRIGARTSPLARTQADQVAAELNRRGVETVFVGVTTTGDVDRRQLTVIGGTGVFATAVRDALQRGTIDVAVHSLKDLPTAAAKGLVVAAVPQREDTRDVLVGRRLADLADGGSTGPVRVGTGAPRRALQLADYAQRSGFELEIVPVRGNVDTRLDLVRTGKVDAVVLAAAGLRRLGRLGTVLEDSDNDVMVAGDLTGQILDFAVMLPAPGQGALALETRADDTETSALVKALDDPGSHVACLVERRFLATLEAGCTAPVGARAVVKSVRGTSADLTLAAVIGRTLVSNLSEPAKSGPPIRVDLRGSSVDPAHFGGEAARRCLAELRDIQRSRPSSGEAEQRNARSQ
jgi:hydroxymethylbilane synthase